MTALVVVLMFVGFVILDFLVRATNRRIEEKRRLRKREEVLHTALRLEFADEARSLKRVEVPQPKATILAVDDEPVVLDSLRRILVLDGFSVDTVESGPEALSLVQRRDYDFLFTDLKMPDMDGVEVVKAVHHLRPDTDIAVITGYATIETAVETMKHGAVAYVQKPFTPDELTEFATSLLIKREARLEAQRRPVVHLVAPALAETLAEREFCVPGGAFVSEGHVWVRVEPDGDVRIGLDDFARKALGTIEAIELPGDGTTVRRGEPLFAVRRGARTIRFAAPLAGSVRQINGALRGDTALLSRSPYDRGWVCLMQPADLPAALRSLRIGEPVVTWYQDEIARLRSAGGPAEEGAPAVDWETFERQFLQRSQPVGV
ncbi:MAG TPA: response regulator [Candidatus Polarisedimenticolia bacterium]|nr:response regulator [Candidatus Polarisedimenticolia bacterium]